MRFRFLLRDRHCTFATAFDEAFAGSTMARTVPGWNPRPSEGAVTATGQSLIDLGLPERASRR